MSVMSMFIISRASLGLDVVVTSILHGNDYVR